MLVRPRYRANWVIGRYRLDGFVWYIRGTNFPMSHEEWLRSLVQPFSGCLFVDIGAHVGTWAVRATRSFQQVLAFEPDPTTNKILRTNIELNKLVNIRVIQASLSKNTKEILSAPHAQDERRIESHAAIRTLDSYHLRPTMVKIDTEGNEFPILEGALETLKQKPRLVIETHDAESVQRIGSLLKSYSFSIKEVQRMNRFNHMQTWLLCD